MLIEDHSIIYLNLQDISGIKFDSDNNVTEIINYRDKLFEYKIFRNSPNHTFYYLSNTEPNVSYLKTILSNYFKSNIIEDYRIAMFIVIREGDENDIFNLYNNDESLQLLHAKFNHNTNNINKLDLILNTTDIHTLKTLETDILRTEKMLICISWNGINSAVYINGKKYSFTHSGVASSTSGNHILHTSCSPQIPALDYKEIDRTHHSQSSRKHSKKYTTAGMMCVNKCGSLKEKITIINTRQRN